MAALPLRRNLEEASTRPDGEQRPDLALLPRPKRWPAFVLGAVLSVVFGALLGIAVFHTQLAGRQLEIDRLEKAANAERERFDDLRHERAVLRSPARLDQEAEELMMIRGASSDFLRIVPHQLAMQLAAAGSIEDDAVEIIVNFEPLEQFRDVKSVSVGQP